MLNKNFNSTQHQLKGIILKYYYEDGVNISLIQNLTKLAISLQVRMIVNQMIKIVTCPTARIRLTLETVISHDKQSNKSGISGVPYCFIRQVNGNENHIL